MNRPARFMVVVPLLSMFMGMSLSALAEEPRRGQPRATSTMHTAASIRTILTIVFGRSGARIPTAVGGDAAAIGGGLMAIGISTTTL